MESWSRRRTPRSVLVIAAYATVAVVVTWHRDTVE
jgi:hypothetical protein